MFVIIHRTYEAATNYAYPVVEHRFFGRTREEAEGYYRAHRQADAFLRGCDDVGRYPATGGPNAVRCRTVVSFHQVPLSAVPGPLA